MHSSNCKTNAADGWTLNQGLAAQYAAQAGLDPDLAAEAGEEVWDVLKSLRDATSETDPKRQAKLIRRTKTRLAKANLSRHGDLVQHIEAKLLALQGRGGDTELAHVTPGEVIVPPQLQTPAVVQALQQAAHNAGIDLRRYTAGSPASSVNPETGLEEYRYSNLSCSDLTPTGLCIDPNIEHMTVTGQAFYPGMTSYGGNAFSGIGFGTGGAGGPAGGGTGDQGDSEEEGPEYGTPGNPVPAPPEDIEKIRALPPGQSTRPWWRMPEIEVADAGGKSFISDDGNIYLYNPTCPEALRETGFCTEEDRRKIDTPLPRVPKPAELAEMTKFELVIELGKLVVTRKAIEETATKFQFTPGIGPIAAGSVPQLLNHYDKMIDAYKAELDGRDAN